MNATPKSNDGLTGGRVAAFLGFTAISTALLVGCGHSNVSSRQLDYDNGLAYLHGQTEPFSGTAHYDSVPGYIQRALMDMSLHSPGFNSTIYAQECDVAFEKGKEEGDVRCMTREGQKALTLAIHHDRFDGEAVAYNKDGDKLSITHWKDGTREGDQTFYSADGKYVVHSYTVEDGHKRGKEVWRAQNGDDLSEGSWGSDGKFDGSILENPSFDQYYVITTYDDGIKDGPYYWIFLLNSRTPTVEGRYKDGKKVGTWTYHASVSPYPMAAFDNTMMGSPLSRAFHELTSPDGAVTKTLTYDNDILSGPVTVSDKDDNVLTSFSVEDAKIKGPSSDSIQRPGKRFRMTPQRR